MVTDQFNRSIGSIAMGTLILMSTKNLRKPLLHLASAMATVCGGPRRESSYHRTSTSTFVYRGIQLELQENCQSVKIDNAIFDYFNHLFLGTKIPLLVNSLVMHIQKNSSSFMMMSINSDRLQWYPIPFHIYHWIS